MVGTIASAVMHLAEKQGRTCVRPCTGRPYGFTYSIRGSSGSTQYYYITNLQGDIIGIMNSSRQVIAKYRHVHFEIIAWDGNRNPQDYLPPLT